MTGDFAGLAKLGQMLKSIEPNRKELAREVAKRFAPTLATFITSSFDAGTDPYGRPFKPLAPSTIARGRTSPPMTDSGKARRRARVVARREADKVSFPGYVRYHLTTGRGLLPPAGKPWPPKWLEALRDLAATVAKNMMGGE